MMENNQNFTYQYSAAQNKEVESIRDKYLDKGESKLDTLRRLDRCVSAAGMLPSLTVGIIGCLIFGIGMCFGLDALAGPDILTLIFCGLGAVVMAPAYPIYRRISRKTRTALQPEILRLSDELMQGEGKN